MAGELSTFIIFIHIHPYPVNEHGRHSIFFPFGRHNRPGHALGLVDIPVLKIRKKPSDHSRPIFIAIGSLTVFKNRSAHSRLLLCGRDTIPTSRYSTGTYRRGQCRGNTSAASYYSGIIILRVQCEKCARLLTVFSDFPINLFPHS